MKKTCIKCEKKKNVSEFYTYKSGVEERRYYSSCKECKKIHQRENYKRNRNKPNKRRERYLKEYAKRPGVIQNRNEYFRIRSSEDPKFNLNLRMKTAVLLALGGKKAGRKWEFLVGYTLRELMSHLESLFLRGMSWDNIGEWHIDHKKPKSLFNYTCPEDNEFKKCWTLENLQPLWAEDNMKKGSKYKEEENVS